MRRYRLILFSSLANRSPFRICPGLGFPHSDRGFSCGPEDAEPVTTRIASRFLPFIGSQSVSLFFPIAAT